MATGQPYAFAPDFVRRLREEQQRQRQKQQGDGYSLAAELPHYDGSAPEDTERLVTRSTPHSFRLGTGASIYAAALLPAILSARHEVILVTCFWAAGPTLTALRGTLEEVARRRLRRQQRQRQRDPPASEQVPPLRVRICFSSRSLLQKLLHPTSREGYVYQSRRWAGDGLGLPDPSLLAEARVELRVKTLFFLPFGVAHPKFVIVDRERAFLPSCNVSWEAWLEGCVEFGGEAVGCLYEFYRRTWEPGEGRKGEEQGQGQSQQSWVASRAATAVGGDEEEMGHHEGMRAIRSSADVSISFDQGNSSGVSGGIKTIILPSSHHRNPRFRPFPWQPGPSPFPTPLNVALTQLLEGARRSVYVQTPNLTSAPVVDALLAALDRGVDAGVVTGRGMMVLEQLVTAGTTTAICLRRLVRRYRALEARPGGGVPQGRGRKPVTTGPGAAEDDDGPFVDLEAQPVAPGRLRISYFCSRMTGPRQPPRQGDGNREDLSELEEPAQSHLKLTIVDGEFTVLGSGNMDRASWFTSQELGVLVQDRGFATRVKEAVDGVLEGRLSPVFDSGA